MTTLDLEKFQLEGLVFEARFTPSNWMHWDRAGAIWTETLRKFPDMRNAGANPGKVVFELGKSTQLFTENQKLAVHGLAPVDTEAIQAASDELTKNVANHLRLDAFSRLGIRITLNQEMPTIAAASDYAFRLLNIPVVSGKHFDVDAVASQPDMAVRFEGKSQGVHVRVAAQSRKISFNPPTQLSRFIEPVTKEMHGVIIDLDVYRTGTIPPSAFRPSDLIQGALRVVRRDLPGFLKAK